MTLEGAHFICLDEAGNRGKIVKAKGRKFTVGYYTSCDLVIDDERAKGVHCTIDCDAFGRITIGNLCPEHPIAINGEEVTNKRILFNKTTIQILDKSYLWEFATKNVKEFEDVPSGDVSTPQKQIGIPQQSAFSCPDVKHTQKTEPRFTVHNFAYCIQSDDEGNTSRESNDNDDTSAAVEELADDSAKSDTKDVKEIAVERREVTPEPSECQKAPVEAQNTPKMNLINCTNNKENSSSTHKNNHLQLSLCHQSDVVITSFSPRETGVKAEKSFTAILKPKVLVTRAPNTPKSVYSTPKSVLGDDDDDDEADKSKNMISFHTPSTSKKGVGGTSTGTKCFINTSMHLVDFTTPNKLAPASPYLKTALKASAKKLPGTPSAVKAFKERFAADEQLGVSAMPITPVVSDDNKSNLETPSSVQSVISVDSTDTSSVIELLSDESTPGTNTNIVLKTPGKCGTGKVQATTPMRTPQSLMKRAILTSTKKQAATPHKPESVAVTPRREPINRIPLRSSIGSLRSPTTPNTPTRDAQLSRRLSMSTPSRKSLAAPRFESTPSTNTKMPTTPSSSRRSSLIPMSASRAQTSTPYGASNRKHAACKTSPLKRVRKSVGGIPLSSHISKARRSIISAAPSHYTSIKEKSPQQVMSARLVTRARKSVCVTPMVTRAISMGQVAKTASPGILKKHQQSARKSLAAPLRPVLFADKQKTEGGKVDDLSRTFILDSDEDETQEVAKKEVESSKRKDVTFSPEESGDKKVNLAEQSKRLDATFSPEKEKTLNATFSPEKDKDREQDDVPKSLEIPLDVEEIAHKGVEEELYPEKVDATSEDYQEKLTSSNTKATGVASKSPQSNEESFAEIITDVRQEILDMNKTSSESVAEIMETAAEHHTDTDLVDVSDLNVKPVECETGFGEESLIEKSESSNNNQSIELQTSKVENISIAQEVINDEELIEEDKSFKEVNSISGDKNKTIDILEKTTETSFVYKPICEDITLEGSVLEKETKDTTELNESKKQQIEKISLADDSLLEIQDQAGDENNYKDIVKNVTKATPESLAYSEEIKPSQGDQSIKAFKNENGDKVIAGVSEATPETIECFNEGKSSEEEQSATVSEDKMTISDVGEVSKATPAIIAHPKEEQTTLASDGGNVLEESESAAERLEATSKTIECSNEEKSSEEEQSIIVSGDKKANNDVSEVSIAIPAILANPKDEQTTAASRDDNVVVKSESAVEQLECLVRNEHDEKDQEVNSSGEYKPEEIIEQISDSTKLPASEDVSESSPAISTQREKINSSQEEKSPTVEKVAEQSESLVQNEAENENNFNNSDTEAKDENLKPETADECQPNVDRLLPKDTDISETLLQEVQSTSKLLEEIEDVLNKSDEIMQKHLENQEQDCESLHTLTEENESEKLSVEDSSVEYHHADEQKAEEGDNDKETTNINRDESEETSVLVEDTKGNAEQVSPTEDITSVPETNPLNEQNEVIPDTESQKPVSPITSLTKDDNAKSSKKLIETLSASDTPKRRSRRTSMLAEYKSLDTEETTDASLQTVAKTLIESDKNAELTPRRSLRRKSSSMDSEAESNNELRPLPTFTPRRSARRASTSLETSTAYTPASKKSRRASLSAVTEAPLTPKRITRRRSSISLDTEEAVKVVQDSTKPCSSEEVDSGNSEEVTEDMGAIIEEDEEEEEKEVEVAEPVFEETQMKKTHQHNITEIELMGTSEAVDIVNDEGAVKVVIEENVGEIVSEPSPVAAAVEDAAKNAEISADVSKVHDLTQGDEGDVDVTETAVQDLTQDEEDEDVVAVVSESVQDLTQDEENIAVLVNASIQDLTQDEESICKVISDTVQDLTQDEENIPDQAITTVQDLTLDEGTIDQDLPGDKEPLDVQDLTEADANINEDHVENMSVQDLTQNEESVCQVANESVQDLTQDEENICEDLTNDTVDKAALVQPDESLEDVGAEEEMQTLVVSDDDSVCESTQENKGVQTPKGKNTVRIAADSPKTPVMTGMRELLKTPKPAQSTPKLGGIRHLVRTPKAQPHETEEDETEKFKDVQDMVKTPKPCDLEDSELKIIKDIDTARHLKGVELMKTPKTCSTPRFKGVRELMQTPKASATPVLSGVKELLDTPVREKEMDVESTLATAPKDIDKNLKGVKELLKTPKSSATPRFVGMRELMQTPKTGATPVLSGVKELLDTSTQEQQRKDDEEEIYVLEADVPTTSSEDTLRDLRGVKELLKTPKGCSTPRFKGIRELMQTPKMSSTPGLGGLKELMDTPKHKRNEGDFDKFLKTPTAKNIMIPTLPSSAIIEKSEDSVEMIHSTEYDLNDSHVGGSSHLEELFKTPVGSRFVERITTSFYGEEGNAECVNQEDGSKSVEENADTQTPLRKGLPRKSLGLKTSQFQSPFSAAEVLSDLSKTEVEEWVEQMDPLQQTINVDDDEDSDIKEVEVTKPDGSVVTLEDSLIGDDKRNESLSMVPETCCKSYLADTSASVNNTSEAMINLSSVGSSTISKDPLGGTTASKLRQNEKRPPTPIDAADISGINLLDQTGESVLDESLVVSDDDDEEDNDKNLNRTLSQSQVIESHILAEDENDLTEPLLLSDSDEPEKDTNEKPTDDPLLSNETKTSVSNSPVSEPAKGMENESSQQQETSMAKNEDEVAKEEEENLTINKATEEKDIYSDTVQAVEESLANNEDEEIKESEKLKEIEENLTAKKTSEEVHTKIEASQALDVSLANNKDEEKKDAEEDQENLITEKAPVKYISQALEVSSANNENEEKNDAEEVEENLITEKAPESRDKIEKNISQVLELSSANNEDEKKEDAEKVEENLVTEKSIEGEEIEKDISQPLEVPSANNKDKEKKDEENPTVEEAPEKETKESNTSQPLEVSTANNEDEEKEDAKEVEENIENDFSKALVEENKESEDADENIRTSQPLDTFSTKTEYKEEIVADEVKENISTEKISKVTSNNLEKANSSKCEDIFLDTSSTNNEYEEPKEAKDAQENIAIDRTAIEVELFKATSRKTLEKAHSSECEDIFLDDSLEETSTQPDNNETNIQTQTKSAVKQNAKTDNEIIELTSDDSNDCKVIDNAAEDISKKETRNISTQECEDIFMYDSSVSEVCASQNDPNVGVTTVTVESSSSSEDGNDNCEVTGGGTELNQAQIDEMREDVCEEEMDKVSSTTIPEETNATSENLIVDSEDDKTASAKAIEIQDYKDLSAAVSLSSEKTQQNLKESEIQKEKLELSSSSKPGIERNVKIHSDVISIGDSDSCEEISQIEVEGRVVEIDNERADPLKTSEEIEDDTNKKLLETTSKESLTESQCLDDATEISSQEVKQSSEVISLSDIQSITSDDVSVVPAASDLLEESQTTEKIVDVEQISDKKEDEPIVESTETLGYPEENQSLVSEPQQSEIELKTSALKSEEDSSAAADDQTLGTSVLNDFPKGVATENAKEADSESVVDSNEDKLTQLSPASENIKFSGTSESLKAAPNTEITALNEVFKDDQTTNVEDTSVEKPEVSEGGTQEAATSEAVPKSLDDEIKEDKSLLNAVQSEKTTEEIAIVNEVVCEDVEDISREVVKTDLESATSENKQKATIETVKEVSTTTATDNQLDAISDVNEALQDKCEADTPTSESQSEEAKLSEATPSGELQSEESNLNKAKAMCHKDIAKVESENETKTKEISPEKCELNKTETECHKDLPKSQTENETNQPVTKPTVAIIKIETKAAEVITESETNEQTTTASELKSDHSSNENLPEATNILETVMTYDIEVKITDTPECVEETPENRQQDKPSKRTRVRKGSQSSVCSNDSSSDLPKTRRPRRNTKRDEDGSKTSEETTAVELPAVPESEEQQVCTKSTGDIIDLLKEPTTSSKHEEETQIKENENKEVVAVNTEFGQQTVEPKMQSKTDDNASEQINESSVDKTKADIRDTTEKIELQPQNIEEATKVQPQDNEESKTISKRNHRKGSQDSTHDEESHNKKARRVGRRKEQQDDDAGLDNIVEIKETPTTASSSMPAQEQSNESVEEKEIENNPQEANSKVESSVDETKADTRDTTEEIEVQLQNIEEATEAQSQDNEESKTIPKRSHRQASQDSAHDEESNNKEARRAGRRKAQQDDDVGLDKVLEIKETPKTASSSVPAQEKLKESEEAKEIENKPQEANFNVESSVDETNADSRDTTEEIEVQPQNIEAATEVQPQDNEASKAIPKRRHRQASQDSTHDEEFNNKEARRAGRRKAQQDDDDGLDKILEIKETPTTASSSVPAQEKSKDFKNAKEIENKPQEANFNVEGSVDETNADSRDTTEEIEMQPQNIEKATEVQPRKAGLDKILEIKETPTTASSSMRAQEQLKESEEAANSNLEELITQNVVETKESHSKRNRRKASQDSVREDDTTPASKEASRQKAHLDKKEEAALNEIEETEEVTAAPATSSDIQPKPMEKENTTSENVQVRETTSLLAQGATQQVVKESKSTGKRNRRKGSSDSVHSEDDSTTHIRKAVRRKPDKGSVVVADLGKIEESEETPAKEDKPADIHEAYKDLEVVEISNKVEEQQQAFQTVESDNRAGSNEIEEKQTKEVELGGTAGKQDTKAAHVALNEERFVSEKSQEPQSEPQEPHHNSKVVKGRVNKRGRRKASQESSDEVQKSQVISAKGASLDKVEESEVSQTHATESTEASDVNDISLTSNKKSEDLETSKATENQQQVSDFVKGRVNKRAHRKPSQETSHEGAKPQTTSDEVASLGKVGENEENPTGDFETSGEADVNEKPEDLETPKITENKQHQSELVKGRVNKRARRKASQETSHEDAKPQTTSDEVASLGSVDEKKETPTKFIETSGEAYVNEKSEDLQIPKEAEDEQQDSEVVKGRVNKRGPQKAIQESSNEAAKLPLTSAEKDNLSKDEEGEQKTSEVIETSEVAVSKESDILQVPNESEAQHQEIKVKGRANKRGQRQPSQETSYDATTAQVEGDTPDKGEIRKEKANADEPAASLNKEPVLKVEKESEEQRQETEVKGRPNKRGRTKTSEDESNSIHERKYSRRRGAQIAEENQDSGLDKINENDEIDTRHISDEHEDAEKTSDVKEAVGEKEAIVHSKDSEDGKEPVKKRGRPKAIQEVHEKEIASTTHTRRGGRRKPEVAAAEKTSVEIISVTADPTSSERPHEDHNNQPAVTESEQKLAEETEHTRRGGRRKAQVVPNDADTATTSELHQGNEEDNKANINKSEQQVSTNAPEPSVARGRRKASQDISHEADKGVKHTRRGRQVSAKKEESASDRKGAAEEVSATTELPTFKEESNDTPLNAEQVDDQQKSTSKRTKRQPETTEAADEAAKQSDEVLQEQNDDPARILDDKNVADIKSEGPHEDTSRKATRRREAAAQKHDDEHHDEKPSVRSRRGRKAHDVVDEDTVPQDEENRHPKPDVAAGNKSEDSEHHISPEKSKPTRGAARNIRKKNDDDHDLHDDHEDIKAASTRGAARNVRKKHDDGHDGNEETKPGTTRVAARNIRKKHSDDQERHEDQEENKAGTGRGAAKNTHKKDDDSHGHQDEEHEQEETKVGTRRKAGVKKEPASASGKRVATRRKNNPEEIHDTQEVEISHEEISAAVHTSEDAKKGRGRKKLDVHKDEEKVDDIKEQHATTLHSVETKPRSRKRKESHTEHEEVATAVIISPETPERVQGSNEENNQTPDSAERRARNVPQRRAAIVHHNYDETSDSEKPEKKKKKMESPRKSVEALKPTNEDAIISAESSSDPSPASLTPATTARGRTRKPTARVQKFLEEERAKAESPRKRGALADAIVADTPTKSQSVKRGGRATATGTQAVGTPQTSKRLRGKIETESEDHDKANAEIIESVHTTPPPATTSSKGRKGARKAKPDVHTDDDKEEPPAKKSPQQLRAEKEEVTETTTHQSADESTPTRTTGRRNAAAAAKVRIEEDALAASDDVPKKSRAKRVPAKVAGSPAKREHRLASASTVDGVEDLQAEEESHAEEEPKTATKRMPRKAAATSTASDSPAVPAKKSRKAKTETEIAEIEVDEPKTSRATARGRKNVHFASQQSVETPPAEVPQVVEEPQVATTKRATRVRRK